jgi:hypothetical protein
MLVGYQMPVVYKQTPHYLYLNLSLPFIELSSITLEMF